MRPEILFPLFKPVTEVAGVGARTAKLVDKLTGGDRLLDLILHLPTGLIDRSYTPNVAEAEPGRVATLTLTVDEHAPGRTRRQPYRIACSDETGTLILVFFHARADYLAKQLPTGETRVVSGKLERYGDTLQITHPDHIAKVEERDSVEGREPTYPLTAGLTQKPLRKSIEAALSAAPDMPEWLDGAYLAQQGWSAWKQALTAAHHPDAEPDLSSTAPARARLAYDELLANQLALNLLRKSVKRLKGRSFSGAGALRAKLKTALPFDLTESQVAALRDIYEDMARNERMLRLLQGDVGSGKTVVALMTLANVIECGAQGAIMAPTEVLARQHLDTLSPLCEAAGLTVALLTGREKGKTRDRVLEGLSSGETRIAIGTHALFTEDVGFKDLGAVVIDEQHRFGVHQRLALSDKGHKPDILVMTATPIPRTLMLTAYGDMDVSRLTGKPPGRKPVETRNFSSERIGEIVARLRGPLSRGEKVFWVCPLVEESEAVDAAAAEDRHRHLARVFGSRAGLLHGRMTSRDKDAAMAAFVDGEIDILVSTTVVEVGVNVPAASVMIIEHAERFGLAQLHQLRGRVGRGEKPSNCLLIHGGPLSRAARQRLEIMAETDDGFVIAEKDLELRGAGELLGARQSGLPAFKLASIEDHGALLTAARDDARLILNRDPKLTSERGEALRVLLYLFERDAAARMLRSG